MTPSSRHTDVFPPTSRRWPPAYPLRAPQRGRGRDAAGIATLEWLLVIAAAGGFAAVMSVALQGLVDDARRVDEDPSADLVEASIAAVRISDDAIAAQISLAQAGIDAAQSATAQAALDGLERRCANLAAAYPDAVAQTEWAWIDVGIELPADGQTTLTSGRWACQVEIQPQ